MKHRTERDKHGATRPFSKLTCRRFVAVVAVTEVLWIFDDRDSGHTDDDGIGSSIQCAWA